MASQDLIPEHIQKFLMEFDLENESLIAEKSIKNEEMSPSHDSPEILSKGKARLHPSSLQNGSLKASTRPESLRENSTSWLNERACTQHTETDDAKNYSLSRYLRIDPANEPLRLEAMIALREGKVREGEDMMKRKLMGESSSTKTQSPDNLGLDMSNICEIDSASDFLGHTLEKGLVLDLAEEES